MVAQLVGSYATSAPSTPFQNMACSLDLEEGTTCQTHLEAGSILTMDRALDLDHQDLDRLDRVPTLGLAVDLVSGLVLFLQPLLSSSPSLLRPPPLSFQLLFLLLPSLHLPVPVVPARAVLIKAVQALARSVHRLFHLALVPSGLPPAFPRPALLSGLLIISLSLYLLLLVKQRPASSLTLSSLLVILAALRRQSPSLSQDLVNQEVVALAVHQVKPVHLTPLPRQNPMALAAEALVVAPVTLILVQALSPSQRLFPLVVPLEILILVQVLPPNPLSLSLKLSPLVVQAMGIQVTVIQVTAIQATAVQATAVQATAVRVMVSPQAPHTKLEVTLSPHLHTPSLSLFLMVGAA
ncbi:hypothetical protein GGR51DRAFT_230001 [Nemania sp. FL0031]|nr:hypothetical protein GGR51DRAFT_230001 [Nemania sp. FL0031]